MYGALRARLEQAGTPLCEPEMRIAAIALAHNLIVITGATRHFRCPDLFRTDRMGHPADKESVRETLFHLMHADRVVAKEAVAGAGTGILQAQLAARREERENGVCPKGHIEEVLLEALKAFDDVPAPTRDHEIHRPDGALVTVPDFAWPDVALAVYCDGYQYHGDRDVLELDAAKRNYLQREGWAVLQYWGRVILNKPDRCAAEIAETWRQRKRRREGV